MKAGDEAAGGLRADRGLPASFIARLARRLEACDQPLIQLWAWPWSGKRRLLEALAARQPGVWSILPPRGALVDRLSAPGKQWWVAGSRYRSDELLAAVEVLRPEQRLIVPCERRLEDEVLPQRIIEPRDMLLRPAEIEEMFAGVGDARVGELSELSDGWLGPLRWLSDRWRGEDSPTNVLGAREFVTRFHQRVTGRLDAWIFDAIIECSVAEELDPALWRRVWIDRPEKLAALERLFGEWGWVISESGTRSRLPRLLRRATRARRPPPERQREIYRRLGLAAHGLGLEAEAERYLGLAGDVTRLDRMRALNRPTGDTSVEAPTSEAPAPSLPTPLAGPAVTGPSEDQPSRVARPRFRIQLLGQPVVRRIDSDGREQVLSWRLRRALQSVAYLALASDRRATKEQLVDAVWHDASLSRIAKNFHPTLSEARRTLGYRDAFVYNQGLYTLNPELGWWIDCDRFSEFLEQGRRLSTGSTSELKEALEVWLGAWKLYRGELLSGIEADWIRGPRAVFSREYIELLRDIGGLCARLGRLTQALDAYRSLLLEEPFEERVHLAVMELYARQGRRDLVRRQFVRMQELLQQELNVEPVEETRERYHQLMR